MDGLSLPRGLGITSKASVQTLGNRIRNQSNYLPQQPRHNAHIMLRSKKQSRGELVTSVNMLPTGVLGYWGIYSRGRKVCCPEPNTQHNKMELSMTYYTNRA